MPWCCRIFFVHSWFCCVLNMFELVWACLIHARVQPPLHSEYWTCAWSFRQQTSSYTDIIYYLVLLLLLFIIVYIYIYLGIYFKLLSPPAQEHLHPTSSGRSHQRHGTPWSSGDGAPGPGQGVWLRGGSAAPRNLCARWCLDPSQKFHVDPALRRCTSARCGKFRHIPPWKMGTYGNWKSKLISIHHNPSMNHDISWYLMTCDSHVLRPEVASSQALWAPDPNTMAKKMSDRMFEYWLKECKTDCQIKCQKECHGQIFRKSQHICQHYIII